MTWCPACRRLQEAAQIFSSQPAFTFGTHSSIALGMPQHPGSGLMPQFGAVAAAFGQQPHSGQHHMLPMQFGQAFVPTGKLPDWSTPATTAFPPAPAGQAPLFGGSVAPAPGAFAPSTMTAMPQVQVRFNPATGHPLGQPGSDAAAHAALGMQQQQQQQLSRMPPASQPLGDPAAALPDVFDVFDHADAGLADSHAVPNGALGARGRGSRRGRGPRPTSSSGRPTYSDR